MPLTQITVRVPPDLLQEAEELAEFVAWQSPHASRPERAAVLREALQRGIDVLKHERTRHVMMKTWKADGPVDTDLTK